MEQKIIILYARPWSLTDEKTGQQRSGVSVQYVLGDTLKPTSDSTTNQKGYTICKESISNETGIKLATVPAVYSATFTMRAKSGKNVLALSDIEYLEEI